MKYMVNRDVTQEECDWLDETIKKGTIVYKFLGNTYGLTEGIMVFLSDDQQGPLFQLPEDALSPNQPLQSSGRRSPKAGQAKPKASTK